MGNPPFALPSLKRLVDDGHHVLAVVTNPDRPAGRGRKLKPPEAKVLAQQLGLAVYQPLKLSDGDFIAALMALRPELFVVVAFRILPRRLLEIPSRGSINVHASLLPKYRGAAPINWAIINGEVETGITVFFLEPQVDTGDIVLQRRHGIPPEITFGELHDELSELGAEALSEALKQIESGSVRPLVQEDEYATAAPKITPEIRNIDFGNPRSEVANLIRGLSPEPGAVTNFRGKIVKILKAKPNCGAVSESPGTLKIGDAGKGVLVACADGYVEIITIQVEGKRVMTGSEFLNGYHPRGGELMGDATAQNF